MFGEFTFSERLVKNVWQMNRSANGLLIERTKLNSFRLANYRCFTKFAKLSRYTIVAVHYS